MTSQGDAPDPVAQNIEAIAALHARTEQQVSRHQRAVEAVTAFLGRPLFLYLAQAVVAAWIVVNLFGRRVGIRPFDPPPFSWLQGAVSLGALLLAIVILITQNRQGKVEAQRARLDLQISLLAEQKVAKLIALVEELRRDLPIVQDRRDPEAEAMTESVDPHAVLSALEETLEEAAAEVAELKEGAP